MFETAKFGFHAKMVLSCLNTAKKEKEAHDGQKTLLSLKKAIQAGQKALSIQSPRISEEQRATVQSGISSAQKLYQRELIAQMPEEDRELLVSVLKLRTGMSVITIDVHPFDQMIVMFEVAKNRFITGTDKKTLEVIYEDDNTPTSLWNIIQPFLGGEATQETTEKRLDECILKLKKWKLKLFPGKSPPAQ